MAGQTQHSCSKERVEKKGGGRDKGIVDAKRINYRGVGGKVKEVRSRILRISRHEGYKLAEKKQGGEDGETEMICVSRTQKDERKKNTAWERGRGGQIKGVREGGR